MPESVQKNKIKESKSKIRSKDELSGIIHSGITNLPSRVQELLTLTEDLIFVTTIALDPQKIGFEFYT